MSTYMYTWGVDDLIYSKFAVKGKICNSLLLLTEPGIGTHCSELIHKKKNKKKNRKTN